MVTVTSKTIKGRLTLLLPFRYTSSTCSYSLARYDNLRQCYIFRNVTIFFCKPTHLKRVHFRSLACKRERQASRPIDNKSTKITGTDTQIVIPLLYITEKCFTARPMIARIIAKGFYTALIANDIFMKSRFIKLTTCTKY